MKLLHTADWHLGKRLDHISRLEEQAAIMEEICEIADREQVDAVLIAGDLFDQINPSIEAIELFYRSLKRLADNGNRAVIGIAGNHDSPDRIEAPDPLARECGIILLGYPNSKIPQFELDSGLKILRSEAGFLELKLPKSETPLRLLLSPYANEVRLKKYLGEDNKEAALRSVLESHWKSLSDKYCDDQGVNILMAHLFFAQKGEDFLEEGLDEKPILSLGGAQAIFTHNLPDRIQYAALGHIHRPFAISKDPYPVVYSGSPLSYSMAEAGQEKSVVLVEAFPGKVVEYSRIAIRSGKALARGTFSSLEDAAQWLAENQDKWVELTLERTEYLTAADRKKLHAVHSGIVNIIPKITTEEDTAGRLTNIDLNQDMESLFQDYFAFRHDGQTPDAPLLDLFREVLGSQES